MGRLSLSMIVKNEEKYLRDCFESVKNIVDEIIVVDTGSTDETINIAEKYGAKIFNFNWINDFSAARNFALSKSTGDWILYLDADERLDKSSINSIKRLKSQKKLLGVVCSIFNVDEINNKPKLQKYTRLFRNSPKIEFRGRAHEQIDDSLLEHGFSIIDSDISITHLGYNLSKKELTEKARRNLNLLLEDYKQTKSSYTAFQLGNTYSVLADKKNASEYYQFAMNDNNLNREYFAISAAYVADYLIRINQQEQSLIILQEGLTKYADYPLLNLVGSEILLKLKEYDNALNFCKQAYVLNNKLTDSKKSSNLLDVILDSEKIIYHGLNISVQGSINEGIMYFLDELSNISRDKSFTFGEESAIIVSLATNEILIKENQNLVNEIVSEQNLDFYLWLIGNYKYQDVKIVMLKNLAEKFNENVIIKNKLGLAYSQNKENKKAIEIFEDSLENFANEPSPAFYLISLYLEEKKFDKLNYLLDTCKTRYSNDEIIQRHIKVVEDKIKNIAV